MKTLWNKLIANESGLILSAELVLILTIGVIGMVTGLACVQQAVVYELNDLGLAFSSLNQTYWTPTYRGGWKQFCGGNKSFVAGSSFIDIYDGGAGVQGSSMAPVALSFGTVSEVNTGASCPIVTTPSNACPPAAPMPQPRGVGTPCEVCPPGTEVVPCPITVPTVPSQR